MIICAEVTDRCRPSNTPALFVSTAGTRLLYTNVQTTFHQLVCRAGLKPRSASCRPRLHDIRHGFAVRTILDAIAMAATRSPACACCRPISATSTRARHTGTSRPLRNCWSWRVSGWSVTSEVAHDRTRHDLAGVLHRPPDPSAPSQPAYARCIPRHPAAVAGVRVRATKDGSHRNWTSTTSMPRSSARSSTIWSISGKMVCAPVTLGSPRSARYSDTPHFVTLSMPL